MEITLKPVSHPELDDIVIVNGLFHVGRSEPPFSDYPEALIESLSRRHARIFMQDSTPYIADLGSSNGTNVNGKPLKEAPSQLQHGDLIDFAGDLSFHVSLASEASDERTRLVKPPPGIHLSMSSQNTSVDSILVSEFPFLISKDSEVFSKYKELVPEELGFLSRRHAHIYEQNGGLYIEDLGSTNGTFLNGKRINEQKKTLSSGDLIGLGGEYFVFKLSIKKSTTEEGSDKISQTLSNLQASGQHTTFISTATSFLDIFCVEEEAKKDNPQDEGSQSKEEADQNNKETEQEKAVPLSRYRRIKGFFHQLRGALKDDADAIPHRRGILAGLVLLVSVISAAWYLTNKDQRQIEFLCEEKNYAACIKSADSYLAEHEDEKGTVSELATEALLKSLVPDWINAVKKNDEAAAKLLLDESRSLSSHHPEGQKIIGLLDRVATLKVFIHKRGGPEGKIQIYKDEETITKLVEEWRVNSDTDRRMMAKVVEHVPEFESLRGQVFSGLRHLRNDKSLYIAAIESFKSGLKDKLASGEKDFLKEIDRFSSRFPRVSGLELLRDDAEKYTQLQQGKAGGDLLDRLQTYQDLSFQTPLFESKLEQLKEENLPPEAIAERFLDAQKLWQDGMVVDAVTALKEIDDEGWVKDAQAIVQRYEDIASRYQELGGKQRADDYQGQLFAFHGSLDADKDRFFLAAIEGEFVKYRDTSKAQADQLIETAAEGLNRYRNSGGIQSLQRLEEKITKGFKAQSSLLSRINGQITQVQQVYKVLKLELKPDQKSLCKSVEQEIGLQRSALKDLSSVLSSEILNSKLKLLAEP